MPIPHKIFSCALMVMERLISQLLVKLMSETSRKVSIVAVRKLLAWRQVSHARLTMIAPQILMVFTRIAAALIQTLRSVAIFCTRTQNIRITYRQRYLSKSPQPIVIMRASWRVVHATSSPNSVTWCAKRWRPIITCQITMLTFVSNHILISICSLKLTRHNCGAALTDTILCLGWVKE